MTFNWIVDTMNFATAKALVAAVNGKFEYEHIQWDFEGYPRRFDASIEFDGRTWTGIERIGSHWFNQGVPISKPAFSLPDWEPDPDGNGPNVAAMHADSLRFLSATKDDYFMLAYSYEGPAVGTPFSDGFIYGAYAPNGLKLGAGDDVVWGGTVGKVDGGDGDDLIWVETATDVVDGTGYDTVITSGKITPTLDGGDDALLWGWSISYAGAKAGIVNSGQGLYSIELGLDRDVQANQITLGSGDDVVSGYNVLIGGAGNDTLTPFERGEGGAGNDTLIALAGYRADLKGQDGDDILKFFGDAKASGGAGADLFEFHAPSRVTINDLGMGDHIDLSRLFDGFEGSVSDAFAQGYLKSTVSKGYTYVSYDGNGGADGLTDLVTLKGVFHDVSDYLII